jgi:hypothetical protein
MTISSKSIQMLVLSVMETAKIVRLRLLGRESQESGEKLPVAVGVAIAERSMP